ncbi:hypothetical protein HMPREF0072_2149, partial [Anaerococcus lactolyticus ATCC 51172]
EKQRENLVELRQSIDSPANAKKEQSFFWKIDFKIIINYFYKKESSFKESY